MVLKHRIKSSALGYAIAFALLIGLVCSGFLLMAGTHKRVEQEFTGREQLLFNNYLALIHGAKSEENGTQVLVHSTGDTSRITRKNWGAFRVIVSNTFHKSKSIHRSAIVGYESDEAPFALYLPDKKQSLKLCGDTKIEGRVALSERGAERGHISGKLYSGKQLIYGTKTESERNLPPLRSDVKEASLQFYLSDGVRIDLFSKDSSFSFAEKTRILSSHGTLKVQHALRGNVILHSHDSVVVASGATLENVLILAPYVRFEKGFRGAVQVVATEKITCEENVKLVYPSALTLHETTENTSTKQHGIFMEKGSEVLGGVLLFSEKPNFRKPVYLNIQEARIGGFVYNAGTTQLKGEVIGAIYTNEFELYTGGGTYKNHLLDATISMKKLPENFIVPQWLKDTKRKKPKILSCF